MEKFKCAGCKIVWRAIDLQPIVGRIEERVKAGETMPHGECSACGGLCYVLTFPIAPKKKYNHAYQMAFEVVSKHENPDDITEREVLCGLLLRVAGFLEHENDTLQACEPYDMYEM